MPNLKNRLMDQVLRVIRRHMRLEICVVDNVHWHETPDDQNFNSVDVVMRDRAIKNATGQLHYRKQLPCLQSLVGHCLGLCWSPRKGDLVYVLFYGERKGIVLGTVWSWAEHPVCRTTPYDLILKGGQWMEPYQDRFGDFPRQPYPMARKPFCFKWFHGPITGSTGPGRDWCFMFDYCRLGDSVPDCHSCRTIDSIQRLNNHYLKIYSEQTESLKAYPLRAEYHAPCGSYWMFESSDSPGGSCQSEVYTEGEGFWTIQGSRIEGDQEALKGHIRHHPEGDMEIHSATSDLDDEAGARCAMAAPGSSLWDFAAEIRDFTTGAYVRIEKDGAVKVCSPVEIRLTAPKIVLETPKIVLESDVDVLESDDV